MPPTTVEFNLQQFLEKWRDEQLNAMSALDTKLDAVVAKASEQDSRIARLETKQDGIIWLGGSTLLAAIGAVATWVMAHFGIRL